MPRTNVVVRVLPPANVRIPLLRVDIGDAQKIGANAGVFVGGNYVTQVMGQGARVKLPHIGMRTPGLARKILGGVDRIPGAPKFKWPTLLKYPVIQMPSGPRYREYGGSLGAIPVGVWGEDSPAATAGAAARFVIHAPGFRLAAWQNNPHYPKYKNAIHSTKERTADLTPVFRAFQDVWFDNEETIFAAEGIPSWPKLSPNYAIRKQARWPGMPIMRRTDRLYASLTTNTADTVYEYGAHHLKMGTAVPYSRPANRVRPHVFMLPQTWDELNAGVFAYTAAPLFSRRPTAQLSLNAWADLHSFDLDVRVFGRKYTPIGTKRVVSVRKTFP